MEYNEQKQEIETIKERIITIKEEIRFRPYDVSLN